MNHSTWALFTAIGLFCLMAAVAMGADVVTVEPEEPCWGDTLTITYDPSVEGALLNPDSDIYVHVWAHYPDCWSSVSSCYKMTEVDGRFVHKLAVPDRASHIIFRFINIGLWDDQAPLASTKIYRRDGVPVRGAHVGESTYYIFSDYDEPFREELSAYPDNYIAYVSRWQAHSVMEPPTLDSIIQDDMNRLLDLDAGTVEWMYAVNFGHLQLNQFEHSLALIRAMIANYPHSDFTVSALGSYGYRLYEQELSDSASQYQIRDMARQIVSKDPLSDAARRAFDNYQLDEDKELPLMTKEQVLLKWIAEESDNPQPYQLMANVYMGAGQNLDSAESFLTQAIRLAELGKFWMYSVTMGDFSDKLAQQYRTMADLQLRKGNYSDALVAIKTAQGTLPPGEITASYLIREGNIWRKLNQKSMAETAYRQGWHLGSKEARDSLLSLYLIDHEDDTGFEDFLNLAAAAPPDASSQGYGPAPQFHVTSLEGTVFDSQELLGKVIVLNFWSTGCVPCRKEIPLLNELVQKYESRDIVFVALAPDGEKGIRRFIEKQPFEYNLVTGADDLHRKYLVRALPVHVVVDKQGQIAYKRFGGGEDLSERLSLFIDRALAAN